MTMDYDVSGSDFVGADDPLAILGVSGDDYVGDEYDELHGVSGDDFVGQDDEEEVGAALRRIRRGMPLGKALKGLLARQRIKAKNRKLLQQRGRQLGAGQPQIPLGVDVGAAGIAASTQATIQVEPTVALRITDFFVEPSLAADFNINSINVGRTNLLCSADGVMASYFDPTSGMQRAPIEFPLLPAGTVVSVVVTNLALANRRFRGAFQCIDLTTKIR